MYKLRFDRHGGGFVIEVARCSREEFITTWGASLNKRQKSYHYALIRYITLP